MAWLTLCIAIRGTPYATWLGHAGHGRSGDDLPLAFRQVLASHQLSESTALAHRLLTGSPDGARDVARRAGMTYIALCGPRRPDGLSEEQRKRGLWAYPDAGAVPDWLDPVASTIGHPFTVYRVLP